MSFLFFALACGVHTAPQKSSVHTAPSGTANETTTSNPIQTGLHNGVFTGYNPEGVLEEKKENCFRCRRGYSDVERLFIDRCKQAEGEIMACGCFELLCSEKIEPQ